MPFDPYYKWLGIPPAEQPPHYYRLLGLSLFERNADAIENAADRQMGHVRMFQAGPQGADSQRLLKEIAVARTVLLDATRRQVYDEQLRARLSGSAATAAPLVVQVPLATTPTAPPAPSEAPIIVTTAPAVQVQPREAAPNCRPSKDLTVEILKIVGGGIAGIVLATILLRLAFGIDMTGLFPVDEPKRPPIAQRPRPIETARPSTAQTEPSTATAQAGSEDSSAAAINTSVPPTGRAGGKKKKKGKSKPTPMPAVIQPAGNNEPPGVDSTDAPPVTVQPTDPSPTPVDPVPSPAPQQAHEFKIVSANLLPKRLPAPNDADRQAAEQQLVAAYQLSKLEEDAPRQTLAQDLLGVGTNRMTPPAERWVTLKAATELGAEIGDAKLVAQAMDALAQTFEPDVLAEEATLLARASRAARTAEQMKALVEASRTTIQVALANHEYIVARDLASAVRTASDRPSGQPFRKFIFDGQREIVRQQEAWYANREALTKLSTSPDDAEANLTAAKWWIFERGDWDAALPHLSKCGKPLVKTAADLDAPKGSDWLAIANAWYDAGMAEPVTPLWLVRAQSWYAVIDRATISGLDGATIDRRAEELAKNTQLAPLSSQIALGRGAARVHSSLPPVVRRHCMLLMPFERADHFQVGKSYMACDRSGQANHGAMYGVKPVDGRAGMALEFAGQEHFVECPDKPSLNPTSAFTICAWVRDRSPTSGVHDIVSKEDWTTGSQLGYVLKTEQGRAGCNFGNGREWFWVLSPNAVEIDAWLHLAVIYDARHELLLVNGQEVASMTTTEHVATSPKPLNIGRGPFDKSRRFEGVIDEVAVFDMALTAADVQAVIDLGRAGKSLAE